jgi:hypothetical protein
MGGAATNSGIDFQSRVGAFAMVSMFAEVQELTALGLREPGLVERVHFETGDDVDDLMLSVGNSRSFVQAKRTINLSAETDSEFSSVICQVVGQHVKDPGPDAYILATTSSASSRITGELKRLCDSARLNRGHATNPSTKTEANVRDIAYSHIDRNFETLTERKITDDERTVILAKFHVQVLDLEAGAPLERAVLSVLAAREVPSASAAWAELITLALTLAKDRLSIDRQGLVNRLGQMLTVQSDAGPGTGVEAAVRSALDGHMPTGLEIILFKDEARTVLLTLQRFNENGDKCLRFKAGRVTLPNGEQHDVIRRAASMMGMERMLSAAPDLAGEETLIFQPSDSPGDAAPWAAEHRAVARQLLADNPDIISCLRCGRPVSADEAPFVEVDEVDEIPEVGLVHHGCLRPLHRVLGGISVEGLAHNDMLSDFDYRTWLKGSLGGQGAFNGLGPRLQGTISPIAWEPGRAHLSAGTWGVVLEHADGNEHFITKRGGVATLSESQAQVHADSMNEGFRDAKMKNDPYCVSATTQVFGPYSTLLKVAGAEGTPVEIVRALPREMSRAALFAQKRVNNYYAPLLALVELSTNALFAVEGTIFVLTDPLRLPDMVANWKAAGIDVPRLGTAILAHDNQVDSLVASRALRGEQVAVDPLFDLDGKPIAGAWFDPTVLWLADLLEENDGQPDMG